MTFKQPSQHPIQTVALLGSYVPRQCGIATFTKDLRDALAGHIGSGSHVIAMDDGHEKYAYPDEVRYQINQQRIGDYVTAAETLNEQQIDACIIQHEYGIFGGRDGAHVLNFAKRLRMPLIATLHTVLTEPSPTQRSTLKELARLCDRVVVMSQRAQDILESPIWGIPRSKVAYIPHGIPDVPFVDPHYYSAEFSTVGRRVLLTFGLLGPGKGIETALRAMPAVVAKHPDVLYIILGATHPHVLRNEGNKYRESLEKLISDLGLQDHVRFDNKYVSTPDLMKYLGVTDVYVIPYPNPAQITSGTLAYAVGAGKAVVSTPFWHAEELLADGRGLTFPFNDAAALSSQINEMLDNPADRHAVRRRAYDFARPMVWKDVAGQYLDIIGKSVAKRRNGRSSVALSRGELTETVSVKVDFAHVARMSDDCGIAQHAIHATPDRRHGYCTDDNARALIAALLHTHRTGDQKALALSDRYMSFLHYAMNEQTGRFRNFMDYGRRWLEKEGSEDSHGRAVWALGFAVRAALTGTTRALAARLLRAAVPVVESFTSPRAVAFTVIGLCHHLRHYAGDTQAMRQLSVLAERLFQQFTRCSEADWPWLEEVVTYDNAKLPHALLVAGEMLERPDMIEQATKSLHWLLELQVDEAGTVSLIGNDGWLHRDGRRARFDQQPIEAMAMVEACCEAARVTSNNVWYDHARTCLGWFTGANELGVNLIDADTGGCCDGLHTAGMNFNQGAESTLAWVIAALVLAEATDEQHLPTDADGLDGLADAANVRGLL